MSMITFKLCDFFHHVMQDGCNFHAVVARIRAQQEIANDFVALEGFVCIVTVVVLFASFEEPVESVRLMIAIFNAMDRKKSLVRGSAYNAALDVGSDSCCGSSRCGRRRRA